MGFWPGQKSIHASTMRWAYAIRSATTGPAPGGEFEITMGADADGTITCVAMEFKMLGGAFPGSDTHSGAMSALAHYNVANCRVTGWDVLCNSASTAAYRAPGAPQTVFPVECCIDEIAQKLGLDPIDMRIRNATRPGDIGITGMPAGEIGYVECLEAAKAHPHWSAPLGPNQGRGVAGGTWGNYGGPSTATVNLGEDGSVLVTTGSPDIGGGEQRRVAGLQGGWIMHPAGPKPNKPEMKTAIERRYPGRPPSRRNHRSNGPMIAVTTTIAAVSAIQSRMSQSRCTSGMLCVTSIKAPRNDSRSAMRQRKASGKPSAASPDNVPNASICSNLSPKLSIESFGGEGRSAITTAKISASQNSRRMASCSAAISSEKKATTPPRTVFFEPSGCGSQA